MVISSSAHLEALDFLTGTTCDSLAAADNPAVDLDSPAPHSVLQIHGRQLSPTNSISALDVGRASALECPRGFNPSGAFKFERTGTRALQLNPYYGAVICALCHKIPAQDSALIERHLRDVHGVAVDALPLEELMRNVSPRTIELSDYMTMIYGVEVDERLKCDYCRYLHDDAGSIADHITQQHQNLDVSFTKVSTQTPLFEAPDICVIITRLLDY